MASPNSFTDIAGPATKVGWGIEGTYGTPVIAQFLTDFRSDSIIGSQEKIKSAALRSSRFLRKGGAGRLAVGGSHLIEVTPTVASKLLAASLGSVTTTPPASVATTGLTEAAAVVTVVTATAHGLVAGDYVIIAGVTATGYNGTWLVTERVDATTFKYTCTTTGLSAATVQGTASPAIFTHVITPASTGPVGLTHIVKKGDIFVHPGTKINEVTLQCRLDEIVTAELACMALEEYMYDGGATTYGAPVSGTHEAYLLPAGAGYAVGDAFNFTHGVVKIDDLTSGVLTTTEDVNNVTWKWSNGLGAKRGIRRTGRGDKSHVPSMFLPSVEMELYFAKSDHLMRSMGVSGGTVYPFKSTSSVLSGTVHLDFEYGSGSNLVSLALDLEAEFVAPVPAIAGADFIMQQVTCEGIEVVGGTPFTLTIKNNESTLLTPAGTALSSIGLPS